MATAAASNQRAEPRANALTGYPQGGLRFDWSMVALSALFIAGLWVDGWAHFHGEVDGSFFTPWHLLFYSAYGVVTLFLGYHQLRNVQKGYTFARALPKGYALSLVGVVLFGLSGVGDMVWHTLFGIEGGTEALMSPTHIGLALGMILVTTGAARAAWLRLRAGETLRGWLSLGALIMSMTLLLSLLTFFTSYANPIVNPSALNTARNVQDSGVTSILFTSIIFSMIVTVLTWNWRLPFGTFTVIFTLNTALLTILNDFYLLIVAAVAAGLIMDVLYVLIKPSAARAGRFMAFAFLAPSVFYIVYFLALDVAATVRWSIHVWTGSIFIAGVFGLMLAVLITATAQPPKPADNG